MTTWLGVLLAGLVVLVWATLASAVLWPAAFGWLGGCALVWSAVTVFDLWTRL